MQKRQAPFTRISRKQTDFLERKYFPRGLILKDPRSMRQEDIIKFFEHAANRQASHGVKDTFRFKAVLSSRKKGDINGTKYNDPAINPEMNMDGPAAASEPEDSAAPVPASTFTFRVQTVPAPVAHTDHTPLDDSAPVPPRPKKKRNQSRKGKAREDSGSQIAPARQAQESNSHIPASDQPKKKRNQSGKGKAREDSGSQIAPARHAQESNSHTPASDHAPARPRPRPRPTGKAKGTSSEIPAQESSRHIPAIEQAPAQPQALTLDQGDGWEPQIDLDPCLDPDFDRNTSLSLTEQLQAPEFSSFESPSISEPDPPCPPRSEAPDLERTLQREKTAIDDLDPEHTLGRTLRRREKAVLPIDEDPKHTPRRKGKKADILAMEEAQQFLAKNKNRRGKKK